MTTPRAPAPRGFTAEQMWRDEIRLGGCLKMLTYCPIPFIFLSDTSLPRPPPAPPWPVLWATCGMAAYCFLWQAKLSADHFIFDVGRRNSSCGSQCVCVRAQTCTNAHTHTHAHTLGSREHHPRSRRVSKWPNTGCLMSVCFASSLFSLHLYFRSPPLYLCLSFIPFLLLLLCIDIYISVCLGCIFALCLRCISMYFFSCYFSFLLFYFLLLSLWFYFLFGFLFLLFSTI